MQLIGVR